MHCVREAADEEVKRLECHSTLVAVEFYLRMGFKIVEPMEMKLTPEITIDGMLLRRELVENE